ncbi:MAG: TetR/AcrR family transcriptional regulator [Myxococcota bacterium]
MGRREQNKARRRAAILDAGKRVFSTVGYDAATIRDIVRESGLSAGTFYNYFPDKESVFEELLTDVLAELRPRVRQARAQATDGQSFIKDAFAAAVDVLLADEENFAFIQRSSNAFRANLYDGEEFAGIFEELRVDMERGMEAGVLPEFPADLMTAAMVGATLEVCVMGIAMGRSPDEIGGFLGSLFFGGLSGFGS